MEEIRVHSWNDLTDRVYEKSWQEGLGRFRSNLVFRGMADADDDLTTTLMRLGNGYERLEVPLLRTFRRYAHQHAAAGDSLWNWLALAQHHGLPTRLLDWTYSPYVAMHFCTSNTEHFGRDGVIWAVDYVKTNDVLPKILRDILEDEGANVFTAEMLNRAASNMHQFDSLTQDEFVTFLEPPSLDERITNQFALFSLMSSATSRFDDWLAQRPELCRRIIIPAAIKWEVRDKLDQANITERVLFPGLDGLSRWLRRYYTPKQR